MRKALVAVLAAGSMILGTIPAMAVVPDNPDVTDTTVGSASANLGQVVNNRSMTGAQIDAEAAAAPNPYGCYGQTDYPHWSSGQASVHGRTRCAVYVGELSVYTDLYRGRWYGEQHLASGSSSREFANNSKDATPHWGCAGVGTYTYQGDSSHEATDGANEYYAYTANSKRFSC